MLVLTAKNISTLNALINFFDFKSMFHVEDVIESYIYFEVNDLEDANTTEREIEKELLEEFENSNLSYYFEYED